MQHQQPTFFNPGCWIGIHIFVDTPNPIRVGKISGDLCIHRNLFLQTSLCPLPSFLPDPLAPLKRSLIPLLKPQLVVVVNLCLYTFLYCASIIWVSVLIMVTRVALCQIWVAKLGLFSKCHCLCILFLLVRSCLLITLIKCLKGLKYLGSLFEGIL